MTGKMEEGVEDTVAVVDVLVGDATEVVLFWWGVVDSSVGVGASVVWGVVVNSGVGWVEVVRVVSGDLGTSILVVSRAVDCGVFAGTLWGVSEG